MGQFIDLAGQRFGRLVVIEEAARANPRRRRVVARCDCGRQTIVLVERIRSGGTRSCGCLARETVANRSLRHGGTTGYSLARWYRIWSNMMTRCNNEHNQAWKDYGGRGIKVCDRWRDPKMFLEDMGEPPAGMTLDRYPDHDGNYEPGNCRWATWNQQARNRRDTVMVDCNGSRMALADACELIGSDYELVRTRMKRGWPANDALTAPVGSKRPKEGRAA